MIKIYIRAIVPTKNAYVLMEEKSNTGESSWELPGGPLEAGKDVKQLLQKQVLDATGYTITDLKFFEIVCKVKPRSRNQDPTTIIDFVFASQVDSTETRKTAQKETDHLDFDKFEWLDAGHRFNLNKTMNLLSRYHSKNTAPRDTTLQTDPNPITK